jgi:flavin-dependent dehydrogenase
MQSNNLSLKNGSRIAIIGGGPAGSFFAHFASRYAKEAGIDLTIKIYDRKSFCQRGPRGCNMCAGVISEKLFNSMEEEGINIAKYCVQREIEGYCFQTQDESVLLHHPVPGHVPKIVTVFRGNGPMKSSHQGNVSFDDYLLNGVKEQGVEINYEIVKDIKLPARKGGPVKLICSDGNSSSEFEAELVVGAFGVNTGMIERIGNLDFGYKPPKTVRTCQCEIILSSEYIEKTFGNNIYVFALGKKELKFASITPKADYITVNLVGRKDLTRNNMIDFLDHPSVRKLMPKGWRIPNSFCMCISKIPVTYAKHPYTDRMVVLGDASISRSYKSGIESAFNMAKLSAYTAFKNGVSEESFMNGYFKPAKRLLVRDNFYGIMMLKINDYLSSQRQIANSHINIMKSNKDKKTADQINEILWNMLTGNVPYKEIFFKAMNPGFVSKILPIDMLAWVRQKREDISAWRRRNGLPL